MLYNKSMEKYIISLDQGTTSSRSVLIDKSGNVSGIDQLEIQQIYPNAGWVEEDPLEIYESQISTLKNCLHNNKLLPENIDSIGITNQRETTILWNKNTGKPIYNAIVWQCRRGNILCKELIEKGWDKKIHKKCGLIVDPYFSATKIKWILDNVPGAQKSAENGDILFGTVDTWLLWKLTGGRSHYTDYSNASRTMLFNINTLKWDEELLELFNIPIQMLPEVKNTSDDFGYTDILNMHIPVNALVGDQQSAMFGQLCTENGTIKNTYGTGCFTLMNIGNKPVYSHNGLLTTIAWKIGNECIYALEGSVFIGGAVISWLRDEMNLISDASESEVLAFSVPDSNGVTFVSTFQGIGTPYWNSEVTGEITGLTRSTKKAHLVRAALESIAFRTMEVIDTMKEDSGLNIKEIKVDGGACRNNFLMTFQSDISNTDIIRPLNVESTALGAAYLAGLKTGFWKDIKTIKDLKKTDRRFKPTMTATERNVHILKWKKAIDKVIK